jgi:hypothetical protein
MDAGLYHTGMTTGLAGARARRRAPLPTLFCCPPLLLVARGADCGRMRWNRRHSRSTVRGQDSYLMRRCRHVAARKRRCGRLLLDAGRSCYRKLVRRDWKAHEFKRRKLSSRCSGSFHDDKREDSTREETVKEELHNKRAPLDGDVPIAYSAIAFALLRRSLAVGSSYTRIVWRFVDPDVWTRPNRAGRRIKTFNASGSPGLSGTYRYETPTGSSEKMAHSNHHPHEVQLARP